jgi:hypothetical protein
MRNFFYFFNNKLLHRRGKPRHFQKRNFLFLDNWNSKGKYSFLKKKKYLNINENIKYLLE